MGMFDYVQLEDFSTLPAGENWPELLDQDAEFQTKSMYRHMETYVIGVDKKLYIVEYTHEEVPAAERPHPDPKDPWHIMGSRRVVSKELLPRPWTGGMCFYTCDKSGRDREFVALFDKGVLTAIEIVENT